jgi:hypothetical protein
MKIVIMLNLILSLPASAFIKDKDLSNRKIISGSSYRETESPIRYVSGRVDRSPAQAAKINNQLKNEQVTIGGSSRSWGVIKKAD